MTDIVIPKPDLSIPANPGRLSRVRRNTLFKIIGESSRAFSVLLYILIARYLGGSEFGSFSVALALATFFAGVAEGGGCDRIDS